MLWSKCKALTQLKSTLKTQLKYNYNKDYNINCKIVYSNLKLSIVYNVW